MDSNYKIILTTLRRELPILKFIFSRNLIVLLTSLTISVLFLPLYQKGVIYSEKVIPTLLSNFIKKHQYLIHYFIYEQAVKLIWAIFVIINFALLSFVFSMGIAWIDRQMNENYVHRDFMLIRTGGFISDVKFVLNWLIASVFINVLFIVFLMHLLGVSRFIRFNMSIYYTPFFTLLYFIQSSVYYVMIKLNSFGYCIEKRDVSLTILKEESFILSSLYHFISKAYLCILSAVKGIAQTIRHLKKMITQVGVKIASYFAKKTAFFRFFLLNECITTIPSALPILIIYGIWSKYRILVFKDDSYFSFIAEFLLAAATILSCLFLVWRWVTIRFIPKNFEIIRTGRLWDDMKFYFALSLFSFVFNLLLSVPLAVVTNKSLLLSPGSVSYVIYFFISFYCFRAALFYLMTKRKAFGFSIQKREVPLVV